jgi:integrase
VKQNKPQSVKTTLFRLRTFFPDQEMTLLDVTPKYAAATYMNVAKAQATDTHRNQLAEVKTFFRWCVKAKKWLKENPIEEIEGVGKRRHGKPQLRIDEARRWLDAANELAGQGDEGAIGAMATLLLGLRAGEVVSRVVRDFDDGGRLLWIPCSKTEAGRRTLEVPDLLRPHLLALTEAKLPTAPLFGLHWRGAGTTPHVVAASLGHETAATTLQSYASPGSAHHADMGRVLTLLKGGQGKD